MTPGAPRAHGTPASEPTGATSPPTGATSPPEGDDALRRRDGARPRRPRGGGKRRLRQHVNPLGFFAEVVLPVWEEVLARPDLPMEVDLGCGHGDFLVALAGARPDLNVVGLEIRRPMAERVQRRIERAGLENAAVVFCNANASFASLFRPSSLRAVHVNFPDPWFKKRHHKRRVMTPELVTQAAAALAPGGELRFMSDFADYAAEVLEMMARRPDFEAPFGPGAPAPREEGRPLSHREDWHLRRGDPVYRHLWRRRPPAASQGDAPGPGA